MSLINAAGKLNVPTQEELSLMDHAVEIITFTDGKLDDGTPYWAYVAVQPSKYAEFIAATKARRRITLNEYGRVVKYGFDAVVPDAVKEEMKRDYGFDDQYLDNMAKKAGEEMTAFNKKKEANRLDDIVAMLKKKLN